jgi:hypothetical protein
MPPKHEHTAAQRSALLSQAVAPPPTEPAPPAAKPPKPPADTTRLTIHVPRDLLLLLLERAARATLARGKHHTVQAVLIEAARAGLEVGEGANG